MKMDRQDFFDYIKEMSGRNPYHELLGIEPLEVGEGCSKVVLKYRDELNNPYEIVHGGVLASLIDVAIGIAVVTKLNIGENSVTADLRVNYLSPLQKQNGYAFGRLVRRGKNTAVGEAEVYDQVGKLVAKATSTYYIFEINSTLWQKQAGIDLKLMSQDINTD